jgi:membrane protein implicated in regulation of membrane protease activity
MSMTLFWLVVAAAAAIVEMLSATFGFIFVTGAALVAAGLGVLGLARPGQVVVFGIVLVLSLLLLRPRLVSRFGAPGVPSRTDRLVGQTGEVIEAIDPVRGGGRVLVAGHDWAARSETPLPVGARIRVRGSDGIILLVNPEGPAAPPNA